MANYLSPDEYRQSANRIALEGQDRINAVESVTIKKQEITGTIAELRHVKAEITATEREIRAQAADARLKVQGSGQLVGMFTSGKTRGVMARGRAAANRNLSRQRMDAMRPYAELKRYVDGLIRQFEKFRIDVAN